MSLKGGHTDIEERCPSPKKNTQTLKDNLQKLNKKAETLENRKIHMEPMPENEIRVNIQRVAK